VPGLRGSASTSRDSRQDSLRRRRACPVESPASDAGYTALDSAFFSFLEQH